MLTEKVARLRQLMSEAVPKRSDITAEVEAQRRFQLHEFNNAPQLVIEQTPRARLEREITRIATWYGWNAEVARALDAQAVSSVSGLDEAAAERLLHRMRQLEQCAQEGYDPPDAPPAR